MFTVRQMAGSDRVPDNEILFEFVRVGNQMRVAAIDVASGTEIVVVMPAASTKQQMQQLALAKLRKKLGAAEPEAPRRLF